MPQLKKYDSRAARQAAYRQRCARSRAQQLSQKGLPALPAVATIPGYARWRSALCQAQSTLSLVLSEMQQYYDDRSETWQESDRGEAFGERLEAIEEVCSQMDDLAN